MIVAAALLVSAALAGWLVPRRLRRADLRRRDPVVLIVAWLLSILGVTAATITGLVLMLLPDHGGVGGFAVAIHHCWEAVQHGSPPQVEAIGGMIGSGLALAMAVRLAVITVRGLRDRARRRAEHLSVLNLAARTRDDGTLWLEHDQPMAFSMSGGVVVATEGLRRYLSAESVAAVLTHERAHVRGRHHLLVATTEALRIALPFVPLFRQAPAAMRELVELVADDAAVRAHGVAAVRSALMCVSGKSPGVALAMAREATGVRLARLGTGTRRTARIRRTVTCLAAGAAAVVGPVFAASLMVLMVGLAACWSGI